MSAQSLTPRIILFPKLQSSFCFKRLKEQVGRKANFKRIFLESAFFNSASSGTWTIYIRSTSNLKGICKTKLSTEVRRIFSLCWKLFELQGVFHDFFTRKKSFSFQNTAVFSKISILKTGFSYLCTETNKFVFRSRFWKLRHLCC